MPDPFEDWLKPIDVKTPTIDEWASKLPPAFPEQEDRMQQARVYIGQKRGGDKEFGFGLGLRLRRQDMQLPFQGVANYIARGIGGVENPAVAMKKAEEAYAEGKATDNQLALLASREYETARDKSLGTPAAIGKGLAQAAPIVSEALVGGAAVKGAAGAVGLGSSIAPAATTGGRMLQSAGIQAAATPLTPGLWFEESQQRAAENGGKWYDPKNVAAPMVKAAFQNAIMGHLGEGTKGLGIAKRIGAGAVLMPAEQAGADALTTLAEKGWKEAGMDEKWTTKTEWGTIGQFARGESGEGWKALATQATMGAMFAGFAGHKADPVGKLGKAVDSLAEAGVPKDKAAEIIQLELAKPPETIQNKAVREFAESLQPEKPPEPPKTPNAEAQLEPAKPAVEPEIVATDRRGEDRPDAVDRRINAPERKRVADMTPEERAKELLTSQVVELPNRRAFDEAGPAKTVAMSDADGLKAFNDKFGYEAGDKLLRAKAEALKQAGLDAYHEKGDEFLYRSDDPKDLSAKMEKAREILKNTEIVVTSPDGKTVRVFKGADFSYGVGDDIAKAEAGLKGHKAEREAKGERARGELRGITEVGPEGGREGGSQAAEEVTAKPVPDADNPHVYVPGKSPHEVTRDQWVRLQPPAYRDGVANAHKVRVESRLKAGREVHPDVLADYPDLAEKYAKQETAKPVEETPPDPNSIKNEFTESERARVGLPERVVPESDGQFFQELQGEMTRIGQEDPTRHVRLVDELIKSPRAVDKVEDALILRRQIELKNEHKQAQAKLEEARKSGDPVRVVEAERIESETLGRYEQALAVSESTGTIWSQAGNARKMMIRDDLSLANQLIQRRKRLGRELNEKERAEVEALSKRLDDIEARLDAAKAADLERAAKNAVSKGEIGKRTKAAKAEVDAAWEGLRKATRGKLFSVEAAAAEAITATAKLAKAYIKLGVAKFADFVEAVRKKSGKKLTPEAESLLQKGWDEAQTELAAEKRDKRLESGTAKLKEKIAARDVAKPDKKEPPRSKETSRLEAERRMALAEAKRMRQADERAMETKTQKAVRAAGELVNFQKMWMLGGDLIPMFRQAGFYTASRPIRGLVTAAKSLKAFKSELAANEVLAEVASRENAKNGKYQRDLKLNLEDITGQNEFLQSSWITEAKLFSLLGRINTKATKRLAEVKGVPLFSNLQRMGSVYLTRLRADYYDVLEAGFSGKGVATAAEGAIYGNAANVFSGKGNLGKVEQASGYLTKAFLAPHWFVSRFQVALGQPILHGPFKYGLSAKARVRVATEYIRAAVGVGAVYAMASNAKILGLPEVDIETDSNSTDFGEIRIGKLRINPLFGLSQAVRFMSQFATGKKKDTESKKTYDVDRARVIGAEFRAKAAPAPGAAMTAAELAQKQLGYTKKSPPKQYPQSFQELGLRLVSPLTAQDFHNAIKEMGLPVGVVSGLLASLGAGVKAYDRQSK